MPVVSIDWTDDIIGRLRALWADRHSTAEIGRRLGISKNAVVGKAHRLNLPARPSPIKQGSKRLQQRRSIPTAPKLTIIAPNPPPSPTAAPPVALVASESRPALSAFQDRDERSSCCWPIGEPGQADFGFCGDRTIRGRPYCEEHDSLAHVRKTKRRRSLEEEADAFA